MQGLVLVGWGQGRIGCVSNPAISSPLVCYLLEADHITVHQIDLINNRNIQCENEKLRFAIENDCCLTQLICQQLSSIAASINYSQEV